MDPFPSFLAGTLTGALLSACAFCPVVLAHARRAATYQGAVLRLTNLSGRWAKHAGKDGALKTVEIIVSDPRNPARQIVELTPSTGSAILYGVPVQQLALIERTPPDGG